MTDNNHGLALHGITGKKRGNGTATCVEVKYSNCDACYCR